MNTGGGVNNQNEPKHANNVLTQLTHQDWLNVILTLSPMGIKTLQDALKRVQNLQTGSSDDKSTSEVTTTTAKEEQCISPVPSLSGAHSSTQQKKAKVKTCSSKSGSSPPAMSPTSSTSSQNILGKAINGKTLENGRRKLKDEPVSEQEADRRSKRRERNRLAAAKCRRRRQDQIDSLQSKVTVLKQQSLEMQTDLQNLTLEKDKLEKLIQDHSKFCRMEQLTSISQIRNSMNMKTENLVTDVDLEDQQPPLKQSRVSESQQSNSLSSTNNFTNSLIKIPTSTIASITHTTKSAPSITLPHRKQPSPRIAAALQEEADRLATLDQQSNKARPSLTPLVIRPSSLPIPAGSDSSADLARLSPLMTPQTLQLATQLLATSSGNLALTPVTPLTSTPTALLLSKEDLDKIYQSNFLNLLSPGFDLSTLFSPTTPGATRAAALPNQTDVDSSSQSKTAMRIQTQ